jgi:glycosyltransferase involved in cell wall biosynthesis
MASCYRALVSEDAITPYVVAMQSGRQNSGGEFDDTVMAGVRHQLVDGSNTTELQSCLECIINAEKPDVIVVCGWFIRAYRGLLSDRRYEQLPIIMTMDTPWWGRPKQWLGRIALRRMLRRISMMVVTGERSWQYAVRLGLPQEKIRRGMYGVDYRGLSGCLSRRAENGWPQRFLFAGRYAPEKAIDVLMEGYSRYRSQVEGQGIEPWPLVCCGTGNLKGMLAGVPGVEDRGFVQPIDMRDELTQAGVFVLPSRYDPWPLALVEACAAGLPVIASEACGSTVEMIRPEYNGYLVPTGNSEVLASAMVRAHQEYDSLPEYGRRANQFAAAFSAEAWAKRWGGFVKEITS